LRRGLGDSFYQHYYNTLTIYSKFMTLESNARFSKIQHLLTKVPNTNARTEIGSPACNEGRIERVVKVGPWL
jgi:hypothetical protein